MRGTTRGQLAALAVAVLALAAPSCTEERTLSAEELVADVNAQGVELTLGEPLHTEDEDKDIYAIELEPLAQPTRKQGGAGQHAGGSLTVYDDGAGAEEGLSACRASADLLCYRAANIVIVLEGGGIEAQRLGAAISNLAEDESG